MAKEPLKKNFVNELIDVQLLPRLKAMGYLLVCLSLGSLSYGYFSEQVASPYDDGFQTPLELFSASGFDIQEDTPIFVLNRKEKIQFYIVAGLFAVVSITCFTLVHRKKKRLGI